MVRVKTTGKTKTATGKPLRRKSAVKKPAGKTTAQKAPQRKVKKPTKCWERTNKMGQRYTVCDTSKGQKGVYKPKRK